MRTMVFGSVCPQASTHTPGGHVPGTEQQCAHPADQLRRAASAVPEVRLAAVQEIASAPPASLSTDQAHVLVAALSDPDRRIRAVADRWMDSCLAPFETG